MGFRKHTHWVSSMLFSFPEFHRLEYPASFPLFGPSGVFTRNAQSETLKSHPTSILCVNMYPCAPRSRSQPNTHHSINICGRHDTHVCTNLCPNVKQHLHVSKYDKYEEALTLVQSNIVPLCLPSSSFSPTRPLRSPGAAPCSQDS
jgi:hypothetical protein